MHAYQNKKFHMSYNVIQVGDVLLVADSDMPRHRWELGIIEDLILRYNRLCRSAVVRVPVELNISNKVIDNTTDTNDKTDSDVSKHQQRVPRRAVLNARDTIKVQLLVRSQD